MSRHSTYPEELLHWIWETSRIEPERLATVSGEAVSVFQTGEQNKADGPDFLNAHIQIGNLKWFGDVEIHWNTQDWIRHGHQTDPNYNRVVLHVVWHHTPESRVLRQDNTLLPTLQLKNYLPASLQAFLERYRKPEKLPCAGNLSYISQKAFEQQIQKAARQYFEQKVNDLLEFWDSSLPPSRAWLKMLAVGLFDGLGISHNRQPLRRLCLDLHPHLERLHSREALISLATEKSGIHSDHNQWKHKGSRPSNHPEVRIRQAASYLWYINQLPFKRWLKEEPTHLWEQIHEQMHNQDGPGKQRKNILFGTVWLPSLFILGNTFASSFLQTRSYELWKSHRPEIPSSLLKPLRSLNFPASLYNHSLGAVYQLRSYCEPRHCERCKVFKSVISS